MLNLVDQASETNTYCEKSTPEKNTNKETRNFQGCITPHKCAVYENPKSKLLSHKKKRNIEEWKRNIRE